MHHATPNTRRPAPAMANTASSNNLLFRNRRLSVAAGLATAAAAFAAVRYKQASMSRNELRQRTAATAEQPNFYVSVDRSGGGI
ncbi:hypothetical protein Micbo1qcDRAFT_230573 [Microdochium bolleyi]|uniref:Uncharacterized protein n=1 Tax=Microdochium bolleyi TaxID=196109 RepID=A0A136JDR8_9PEZI|nr:hypothetical protein Micbo1qcDRAFT_230573 [Microdochium bolleyi]